MADEDEDEALAAVERAMIGMRRSMAQRKLGRRYVAALGGDLDLGQLGVLDAIAVGPGEDRATVGTVAERHGVDPSRASRMVASAVEAGLVARVADPADSRKTVLELTEAGRAVIDQVSALRRRWFAEALAEFTPAERAEFARLLSRFTERLHG